MLTAMTVRTMKPSRVKQAVRLGDRHNMPPPLLTVGQRVCKFKGVSKEILRVF